MLDFFKNIDVLHFFWIAIMIIAIIAEGVTVALVSIWFVIGSLAALFMSFFTTSIYVQFITFAVVSLICLLFIKPLATKLNKNQKESLSINSYIGKKCIITEEIKKNYIGRVKLNGQTWSAISDEHLIPNDLCKVIKVEGVKLIVKKIKEKE